MKAQFKYAVRAHLMLRAVALSAVIVLNLVFGLLGYFSVYGEGGKITAVVFSSLAFFGMMVICIITDYEMLNGICSAPAGYVTILTPVESWRIILPRVITILVEDMVCYTAAISGMVLQSLIVSGYTGKLFWGDMNGPSFWLMGTFLHGYIYIVVLVLFCIMLCKSVFHSRRAGVFLAILATIAVAYAFHLADFVLVPFGTFEAVGQMRMFYNISLTMGLNAGTILYALLSLCKSAALFLASAYLMERKINI